MNSRTDIERTLDGFFAEGPETVADQALVRTLDAVDRTKQRRDLFAPRRFSLMLTFPRLAAAAIVAVIAVGGAMFLLGQRPGVGTSSPTPTFSPAPSPGRAASIPLDTAVWTTFDGSRYGYTIGFPGTSTWVHSPASEAWAGQTSYDMWASAFDAPWADKFYDQATGTTMTALATTIPSGTAEEAFIDAYLKPGEAVPATCPELAHAMTSIAIDGHPARRTTRCGDQAAFVVVGNRMFVFAISAENQLDLLTAYLSTIKLPPDTTSWVPFTSAQYGFTVSHPGDWTEVAASGHWSLANLPDSAEDVLSSKPFDLSKYVDVPSGALPAFIGVEAKVPSGTTADAFTQTIKHIAGDTDCYPFEAELPITIDGHAGTLAYGGCALQYYFAEAYVVLGNRVWIFDLRGQDRSLIVPFLSTVKIDPATVID